MKVEFLKDHLQNKKGDVVDVGEARANYWNLCNVAKPAEKNSKAGPGKKEKNSKAGPNG